MAFIASTDHFDLAGAPAENREFLKMMSHTLENSTIASMTPGSEVPNPTVGGGVLNDRGPGGIG